MAQFTDNIGSVSNRIGVQDPGRQGPGALEALSSVGSALVGGAENILNARRNAQASRAEAATGALESGLARANLVDRLAADDRSLENVSPALRGAVERRRSAVARAEQTGDWSRVETETERFVMEVERGTPDLLDEALAIADSEGMDHYFFRSLRLNQEAQDADIEAAQTRRNGFIAVATENLDPAYTEALSPDELATYGQRISAGRERIAAAAQLTQNREVLSNAQQGVVNGQIITGSTEMVYGEIAPMVNNIASQIQSGGLNGQQRVQAWQQARVSIENIRARAITMASQAGADTDAIDDLNSLFDNQITIMDRYVNDATAESVANQIVAEHQIDFMTAVPSLARLYSLGGEATFTSLASIYFGEDLVRSGDLQRSREFVRDGVMPGGLRSDVNTIIADEAGGASLTSGRQSVRSAESRVRETMGPITEASPETIERNGPDFVNIMMGWARRVVEGGDPSSQLIGAGMRAAPGVASAAQSEMQNFRNRPQRPDDNINEYAYAAAEGRDNAEWGRRYTGMQEYILTRELAPGQFNPRQFADASRTLFGPVSTEALQASAAENPELVRTTFDTGRTMLGLMNGYKPTLGSDSVVFDPETGRYEIDRAEWTDAGLRTPFSEQAASEANRLLDRIINISDLDPRVVEAGLSDKEARAYYATGVLPEGVGEDGNISESAIEVAPETDYTTMLVRQEGGSHSTGYIPTDGSGVTIGAGLDLGQWSRVALRNQLGLSPALVEKLSPYVGLTTRAAVQAQGLNPEDLQLTPEEEAELNEGVLGHSARRAQMVPAWDNLDARSREAVVSIRHWAGQLGAESSKLAPGGQNYLWPVLSREDATRADIVEALRRTLAEMPDDTEARYNRMERIIGELS